jgi:hypothetical protein
MLAERLNIKSSELFERFLKIGWLEMRNNKRVLSELGKQKGGIIRTHPQHGDYIAWPEDTLIDNEVHHEKTKHITATVIGKHFNISTQRFNLLINELGWIEKTIAGWRLTKLGKNLGGCQHEHDTSGNTYVVWPNNILENKDLLGMFHENPKEIISIKEINPVVEKSDVDTVGDFRKRYPAEYRAKDGHYVRSKAELTIDDSLYLWGIAHAYEKKLPNTEKIVYSDFHIPSGNSRPKAVYIEYWGMEYDEKYNQRKKEKIKIYNELDLILIQLNDTDIKNIEDSLQKYLLQHGIKVN